MVSRWDTAKITFGTYISKSLNQDILVGSALTEAYGFGSEIQKAKP
jgi:hypothetical protein